MVILGDGIDILGAVGIPSSSHGAGPDLTGRVEQRAAQVLQQPRALGDHGQAAAAGRTVENGPEEGEAAGLAGQPTDDLDTAGLAEGAAGAGPWGSPAQSRRSALGACGRTRRPGTGSPM